MKKFLSVLLALTVAFTFTFGSTMSAFAADKINSANLNEAKQKVMETLAEDYDAAKTSLHKSMNEDGQLEYASTGIMVDEANWLSALAIAYSATVDDITAYTNTLADTDEDSSNDTTAELVALYSSSSTTKTAAELVTAATTDEDPVVTALQAQFADYQKTLIENVGKVSVANYRNDDTLNSSAVSSPVIEYTKKSSQYVAGELMKYAATEIGKIAYTSADDTISEMTALYDDMNDIFGDYVHETASAPNKAGVVTYTYTVKSTIESKYMLATTASVEATKNESIANLAADIAAFKATTPYTAATAASTPSKADYDAYLAAYNTAKTWLINNEKITYAVATLDATDSSTYDLTNYLVNNVNEAAKAIAAYDSMKSDAKTYNLEKLAENYDDKLTTAYGDPTAEYTYYKSGLTYGALNNTITPAQKAGYIAAIEADIDETVIDGVVYNTYDGVAYYALEWAKVEAAIATAKTAISVAETTADITAAEKALEEALKDANINKKSTVDAMYASAAGKLYVTAQKEATRINNYGVYVNADKAGKNVLVFDPDLTDYDTLAVWYATNDARTDAEITALYDKACASLAASKSKADWEKEAAAVVTQIAALPTVKTIALTDKAAIQAAADAYDAITASYQVYVTNASTLTKAIAQVQALEELDIEAALKTLPAKATVTVADKAAVKAVAEKIKAYEKTTMYTSLATYSVTDLLDKLADIEYENVTKLVEALPAPSAITAADKAAVAAAREALNAYVAEYAADYPYYAAALGYSDATTVGAQGYEKTLAQAEAAIAKIEAAEKAAADAKAALKKNLAIAKVTTKVTGKKIKVTAKKNAKAEYYQFKYKKGTGKYKAAKKALTNTKTFKVTKKGKYTVAVRAVVVMDDGSKVYGAWKTKKVTVK